MAKNRHMENNRRKKRNKEEEKRHKITADKGTTTGQIFDSDQGSKTKTKADKRPFIDNLADEVETAAQMQNMATLYKITKALAGCFKNSDTPYKAKMWAISRDTYQLHYIPKHHFIIYS